MAQAIVRKEFIDDFGSNQIGTEIKKVESIFEISEEGNAIENVELKHKKGELAKLQEKAKYNAKYLEELRSIERVRHSNSVNYNLVLNL